jgi:EAL domain-containing protein (putative c-di-GMP-specific phosphodiesterase class I)
MTTYLSQDAQLAEFLAKAIDHDQLRLFVQPQTSISSGLVVGGEVLLRMPAAENYDNSPINANLNFSSIPITQWIQAALKQGLINPLSEWLFKSVVKLLQEKNQLAQVHIPLSVNMPPDMIDKHFLTYIDKCFAKYSSVDPSQIAIEITEFPRAKNLEVLNQNIQEMRAMGMRVILDDFGSGYATMSYLVELTVDAVKIDQSFVQKAPQSASARAVLKSLIELAKEIDLEVICEGVETLEQLMIVQKMQCDIIQGFLISEPVPFDQFWLGLETKTKPILH